MPTTDGDCPFCTQQTPVMENDLAYAIYDRYPVSLGHLLIIPKRHVADYFEITAEEKRAMHELVEKGRRLLINLFHPDGFNVGVNCGTAAGQSVMHVHIHLIPRYVGDMEDPRGGVRGVIPAKQKY